MSTTRYKIRLWEYDGEASVANAVTFDSFAEAEARFNDLRVSEEMPCVEFIKERIANGCISLTRAISLFKGHKEFVVIRLYYFGEDINGNPREGGTATWEEIAEELSDAGILKEIKTARRWRNKIVNDMAVCVFGIPAAVSAATYRKAVDK